MTTNLLPEPYEDELWYSVIARKLRDWGYVLRAAELMQIHGARAPTTNMAAPLRPIRVAERVFGEPPLSASAFALRHTLIPYYLAFATPARRQAALDLLRAGHPISKMTLGAVARKLTPTWLRFCKACLESDRAIFGESYWRTSHQLPGVRRCLVHDLVLYNSVVPYQPARLDYWTAHTSRCKATRDTLVPAVMGHTLSRAIALVSWSVLKGDDFVSLWISKRRYAELLDRCGFGAARGRVATNDLSATIARFLRERRVGPEALGPSGWWRPAFTAVPGALTPIQHLVLREFIRHRLIQSRQPVSFSIATAHAELAA